jgi:hypothetical protein
MARVNTIQKIKPNIMTNTQTDFKQILQPNGYACDTLINGNITECINYLNKLIDKGFFIIVHDELTIIKENIPYRYEYIKTKLIFQNKAIIY